MDEYMEQAAKAYAFLEVTWKTVTGEELPFGLKVGLDPDSALRYAKRLIDAANPRAEARKIKTEIGLSSKSSRCFIATAACGSDQAEDVVHLQQFRDTVLRPRLLGAAFVTAYEACSPPVARFVARSSLMRFTVRLFVVRPAAALARLSFSAFKVSHDPRPGKLKG